MFKRIAILSFVFLTVSVLAGCGCCEEKCCCRGQKQTGERGTHKKRIGKHLIACPSCGQKMVQIPADDDTEVDTLTIEAIAIPIGPVPESKETAPLHASPRPAAPAPVKAPAAK